jgi:hypothetical protein
MKLTFIAEDGSFKCTMETESLTLHEVLQEFGQFLLGSGFVFDPTAQICTVGNDQIIVDKEGPTHE